jgi:hypothetical protein
VTTTATVEVTKNGERYRVEAMTRVGGDGRALCRECSHEAEARLAIPINGKRKSAPRSQTTC